MLTLSQVADLLQVDVRTVRKLIRLGKLRAKQLSQRLTRVHEAELSRYMEQ
jgi:excisionase family DNA binding protein